MAVVPKVVGVGAGFGGLEVVRNLSGKPVDITLIDRNNFHTFQPLLYQVATAGLNAADVATVVRGQLQRQPNVRFRQDEVTGVDWAAGEVQRCGIAGSRSEEHTSELQSLMRISYAVFCLQKQKDIKSS